MSNEATEILSSHDNLECIMNWTVFWRGGKREVLEGADIVEAFKARGYGHGAVKAVDFYSPGDCTDYVWNAETREWERDESKAPTQEAVRGWMQRNAPDFLSATELAEACEADMDLPDRWLSDPDHWIWSEAHEAFLLLKGE